jgi:hypothetical protein
MNNTILAKVGRMERALQFMCKSNKCENCSTPNSIGECFRDGRTEEAEFLADRACHACVAYLALHGGFPSRILAPSWHRVKESNPR